MRKCLPVLLIFLLAHAASAAPGKVNLRLELDRAEMQRGGEAGIEVLAEVESGWHINAHKPNEAFLIPTEVELKVPKGVSVDPLNYPPPDSHTFSFAPDKTLLVYEGKVGITSGLKVAADFAEDSFLVNASIQYQACNDTTCLPPASASAQLVVQVRSHAVAPPDVVQPQQTGAVDINVGDWIDKRGLLVTLLFMVALGLGSVATSF